MPTNPKVRYFMIAAILSAGWIVVLFPSSCARQWIGEAPCLNLIFLIFTGVLIARLFRSWIACSESLCSDLGRALLIVPTGALVFLTFWVVYMLLAPGYDASILSVQHWRQLNIHDALVVVPWGLVCMTMSFYTVIPYALICQRVMRRFAEEID